MARFQHLTLSPLLLCLLLTQSPAQRNLDPRLQFPRSRYPDERPTMDKEMQQRMEQERAKQRVEEMKRDSQKLLELATELKQEIDRAGDNTLSLDVVKKAEAMEKLAKHIKNNMRAQ